jgi:hypothetical protein
MADWKQITARIRRARTGKDPAAQLSTLYEKTQDAMVAFELARVFETASQNAEAAKWYSTAAARFRRSDWKTKAEQAATRLGAEPSAPDSQLDFPQLVPPAILDSDSEDDAPSEDSAAVSDAPASPAAKVKKRESPEAESDSGSDSESDSESESEEAPETASAKEKPSTDGRRRRGRRGGRNRRKPRSTSTTTSSQSATQHSQSETSSSSRSHASSESEKESATERPVRSHESSMPKLPVEALPTATDAGGIALRGRYGDPGLSSRLSLLEMQFRRLLTCSPIKLDEANVAPAGPGVLLLTDSDLTSYYYVEACQTLRIAIPAVLRGGASRRGGDSIKAPLADHLGIPETRVGKYLTEHCVVRWLQLDEGASHFAHFVNAVLRPVLNE